MRQLEIDLGCNDMDDKEEEDNEDNEICKTTFNNQLDQRININSKIKRIGSKRQSSRNQQTIQTRIFDTVHELYGQGKLKAEIQNGVITIYKTDSLIERIENTFNEYVYDDNTQITLTKSDINSILLDGVEKTINNIIKKYKIELPKPKLKRVVVGENNVDFFNTVVKCDKNPKDNGCGLYALLTELYGYLNMAGTEEQKKELKLSVILWFDTHHDFKEDRYKDAKNVWNDKFKVNGREETFITWYAKKFFTQAGINALGPIYSFVDDVSKTVLRPVYNFIDITYPVRTNLNRTVIPTLLYKISQIYLQNRVFEKKILLHYIVHNFAVTPQGVLPVNYSTTLLRDILYVHKNTYDKLLSTEDAPANSKIKGILQQAKDISNSNDPQREKKLKAVVLKLKQLNKLFGSLNDTEFDNKVVSESINEVITNMLATPFQFTDTLPPFISNPNNTQYVNDAGESKYPLDKEVQYVPAALFDANKSNTYEPADEKSFDYKSSKTKYDDFIRYRNYNTPRLDTRYNYINGGCKLEITPSRTFNKALTKADIRCSKNAPLEFSVDKKYNAILIRYLKDKGITEAKFIEKMYEVLTKFVPGDGKQFVLEPNMTKIIRPKYFNSIKTGPSAQSLVFLTILYRLNSITVINPTGDLPLELIDNIVNLKRLGDYGQVIDAKMANLPFFTIDSMESLMCIIEKVSCYIDFNQGVIIYDNGGKDVDGNIIPEFIRSKQYTGYPRRP